MQERAQEGGRGYDVKQCLTGSVCEEELQLKKFSLKGWAEVSTRFQTAGGWFYCKNYQYYL
jgi:hypothetical protein